MTSNDYLNEGLGWEPCLRGSLQHIRSSWSTQWQGLPFFLDQSIRFLKLDANLPDSTQTILRCAKSLSQRIESFFVVNKLDFHEPAYHNRLHFADTLCCMSMQLAIETDRQEFKDLDWMATALLAALCHDFGHQGKINTFTSEIESQTVELLQPVMDDFKLPVTTQQLVSECILKSDFSLAKQNHLEIQNAEFAYNQVWLNVILNESDIMASCLPEFGIELGNSLSSEWKSANFAPHASVATASGRIGFLSSAKFSSHSSKVLKMNEKIASQIAQLQAA